MGHRAPLTDFDGPATHVAEARNADAVGHLLASTDTYFETGGRT